MMRRHIMDGVTHVALLVIIFFISDVNAVTDPECIVADSRYHEGSCYKVHPAAQTWTNAEADCASHVAGGHLATIANHRVQSFLEEHVEVAAGVGDAAFWIGYSRDELTPYSPYSWIDGSTATYSKWLNHWNNSFDEPSYYEYFSNNTEGCVNILYKPSYADSSNVEDYRYGWEDAECGVARGYICKYPTGLCSISLVSGETPIPEGAISASSFLTIDGNSTVPEVILDTKLSDGAKHGAWSTNDLHSIEYHIQFDLQSEKIIREIWTQGRDDPGGLYNEWVRSYRMSYSNTGVSWTKYGYWQSGDQPKLFIANTDTSTIVKNVLEKPVQARYVRINPIGHRRHMSMRIEIIGCAVPSSTDNSINLNAAPVFYRSDVYSAGKKINIETDVGFMNDASAAPCNTLPNSEYHSAWGFNFRYPIPATEHFRVHMYGKNFPCQQQPDMLSGLWPIVSVHSKEHMDGAGTEDDLQGGFEFCSLIDEELDVVSRDTTCSFLCSCPYGSCSRIFINIQDVPVQPNADYQWKICDIRVLELQ